jgi:hypothetical protein
MNRTHPAGGEAELPIGFAVIGNDRPASGFPDLFSP